MAGAFGENSLEPTRDVLNSGLSFHALLRQIEVHHESVIKELEKKLDDLRQTVECTSNGDTDCRILPAVPEKTCNLSEPQAYTATNQPLEHEKIGDAPVSQVSLPVGQNNTITTGESMQDAWQMYQWNMFSRPHASSMLETKGRVQKYLSKIVHTHAFDNTTALLILFNAIFLGIQTDISARNSNPDDLPSAFRTVELTFCLVFTLEILIRVSAEGFQRYFCGVGSGWNLFDFVIIAADVIEEIVRVAYESKSIVGNIAAFRVLRITRLFRTMRVMRFLRFFKELRLMASSLLRSGLPFLWSLFFLAIVIFVFGVYLTQYATSYVYEHKHDGGKVVEGDDDDDWPTVEALQFLFSSLIQAEYVLFMCVSGGVSWIEVSTPLLEAHWSNAVVFCFFIFFTLFAVLNIITGIFVEAAIQSAQTDRDELVLTEMYAEQDILEELCACFYRADTDRSGRINLQELNQRLQNPVLRASFASVGIHVVDANSVFRLFDVDRSGEIDIREFIWGCLKSKGPAQSIDLMNFIHESRRTKKKVAASLDSLENMCRKLEETKDHMGAQLDFLVCTLKDQDGGLKTVDASRRSLDPDSAGFIAEDMPAVPACTRHTQFLSK